MEGKLEKPEAAKLLNRKQYATLPTYQKKPASYEYYPRLPRLGAICNCSSPFPTSIFVSPRRSLPLNLRLRNRTPSPFLLMLQLLPRILVYKSFFLSADLPPLSSHRYLPLSLYYLLLFPAFVICSCLSGSLHNNGGRPLFEVQQPVINQPRKRQHQILLDSPLYTNRGVRSLN